MAETILDLSGNIILADEFRGTGAGSGVDADDVNVEAGTDGLAAGDLQATLQDIYEILATKANA